MNLVKIRSLRAALAAAALLAGAAVASQASAADVTWNLENVTFEDLATASGSFVYDADTNTYVSWDIVTTQTVDPIILNFNSLSGATYTTNADDIDNTSNNLSNTRGVEFEVGTSFNRDSFAPLFAAPLTDAGGTILLGGNSGRGSEVEGQNSRSIISGEIVSQTVSAAPEPVSWMLMFVGVGVAGFASRRARKTGFGRPATA